MKRLGSRVSTFRKGRHPETNNKDNNTNNTNKESNTASNTLSPASASSSGAAKSKRPTSRQRKPASLPTSSRSSSGSGEESGKESGKATTLASTNVSVDSVSIESWDEKQNGEKEHDKHAKHDKKDKHDKHDKPVKAAGKAKDRQTAVLKTQNEKKSKNKTTKGGSNALPRARVFPAVGGKAALNAVVEVGGLRLPTSIAALEAVPGSYFAVACSFRWGGNGGGGANDSAAFMPVTQFATASSPSPYDTSSPHDRWTAEDPFCLSLSTASEEAADGTFGESIPIAVNTNAATDNGTTDAILLSSTDAVSDSKTSITAAPVAPSLPSAGATHDEFEPSENELPSTGGTHDHEFESWDDEGALRALAHLCDLPATGGQLAPPSNAPSVAAPSSASTMLDASSGQVPPTGKMEGENLDAFEFQPSLIRVILDYLQLEANKKQVDATREPDHSSDSASSSSSQTGKQRALGDVGKLGLDKLTAIELMQLVEYARYFVLDTWLHEIEGMLHAELPRSVMARILKNPSAVRNFSDAFLRRVDYSSLDFGQVTLDQKDEGASHRLTNGPPVQFISRPSNFSFAVLRGADLSLSSFVGCNFADADLRAANLRSSNFTDASLADANLYGADCSHAHFLRTKFGSKLQIGEASFGGAVFKDCTSMSRTDFSSSASLFGCSFENCDLSRCSFKGVDMTSVDIKNCKLDGANLAGCHVSATFRPSSLEGAILAHTTGLEGKNFVDGFLQEVDLAGCTISLRGADLAGSSMRNCVLEGADLTDCELSGVDFSGAVLSYAQGLSGRKVNRFNLTRSVCVGVDLTKCILDDMLLSGSDFSECNFSGARLNRCKCTNSRMIAATFDGAELNDCDFVGAELQDCRFGTAKVSGCNFVQANLEQSSFEGTVLDDCDFSQSILRTSTGWQQRDMSSFKLKGTDFTGVDLSECNFDELDMAGCILEDAILRSASLCRTRLANSTGSKPDFTKARCVATVFTSANMIGAVFAHADLSQSLFGAAVIDDIDVRHAKLKGVNFTSASLARGRFDKARLQNVDFSDVVLTESSGLSKRDLSSCKLLGCNASKVDFTSSTFAGLQLDRTNLSECKLDGTVFDGCSLIRANFSFASLAKASFKKATGLSGRNFVTTCPEENFSEVNFSGCDLQRCVFDRKIMRRAQFNDCDLTGATLAYCDLTGAQMTNCDLREACLVGSKFDGANLSGADLRAAEFVRTSAKKLQDYAEPSHAKVKLVEPASFADCDLSRTQLQGADLEGVNLSNVKFDGANLSNAIFLRARLKGATFEGAVALRAQGLP